MGIFDVGAGTSIGFSGNLADAKNIWRQNQATLQAARKAAADKAAKDEEKAAATVNDFVLKDPNKYTEKYQPIAMQAKVDLMNKVIEAKRANPNNWTNMITPLVLEAQDKVNFALEQSNVQRELQKQVAEGRMAPSVLQEIYNNNYGKTDDIVKNAPLLQAHGLQVNPQTGAIGGTLFAKPDENSFYGKLTLDDYNKTVNTTDKPRYIPGTKRFVVTDTYNLLPERQKQMADAQKQDPSWQIYTRGTDEYKQELAKGLSPEQALSNAIDLRIAKNVGVRKSERDVPEPRGINVTVNNAPQRLDPVNFTSGGQEDVVQNFPLDPASPIAKTAFEKIKNTYDIGIEKGVKTGITNKKDGENTVWTADANGVKAKVVTDKSGKVISYTSVQSASAPFVDVTKVWDLQGSVEQKDKKVILGNGDFYNMASQEKIPQDDMSNLNLSPIKIYKMSVNGKKGFYVAYADQSADPKTISPDSIYLKEIKENDSQDIYFKQLFKEKGKEYKSLEELFRTQGATKPSNISTSKASTPKSQVIKVSEDFDPNGN